MTLADVATAIGAELRDVADPAIAVRDVVVDSREVTPGALFIALPGERTDGHAFAAGATHAGAAAAVVTADYGGPALFVEDTRAALAALAAANVRALPELTVIGITGSNGKTTTKDLVAGVLGGIAPTVAAPASYNGEVGLPLSALRAREDTTFLVLEYGARGIGHIRDLALVVRPDIAVVLGVGVAHVGVFGSTQAIATAKGELVESLTPDGVAVLNNDDPLVSGMRDRTSGRVVTFGLAGDADVRGRDVALDTLGRVGFVLQVGTDEAKVQLQLYGEHQVSNALAAAAVAAQCGLDVASTAVALSAARPVSRWRMQVIDAANGVTVINDAYNANPDSMAAGLRALVAMAAGRPTWAVLGPMAELGDAAPEAHRTIGRLTGELRIDHVVVVGAEAACIAESATDAGVGAVDIVAEVSDAVALLQAKLTAGDLVLVKASRSAGLERVAEALMTDVVTA